MIRGAALLAGAMLLCSVTPAAAQPASPEERAAAVAAPAIVFVRTHWHGWVRDERTGEVFGGAQGYDITVSCSGAVINGDGYVATASHCVDPGVNGGGGGLLDLAVEELATNERIRDKALARQQLAEHAAVEGAQQGSEIDRQIQVERATGPRTRDVAPATVVDLVAPTEGDVAVLKVPRTDLPAIEVADEEAPVGTPILAIGYPASTGRATDPTLDPSNKNGQISSHRSQDGHPFLEISAAATQGMSGGPVVDMHGRLVGLVSQGSPGETQSFNLVASARTLAELLAGKGLHDALGPVDRDYRAGLDAYFAGDYDTAAEYLDAVLAGVPNHQQARRYRDLAADHGGTVSGHGTLILLIAVCAGIAVLCGAGGFVLLARHRRGLRFAVMNAPTPPYGIPVAAEPPP